MVKDASVSAKSSFFHPHCRKPYRFSRFIASPVNVLFSGRKERMLCRPTYPAVSKARLVGSWTMRCGFQFLLLRTQDSEASVALMR